MRDNEICVSTHVRFGASVHFMLCTFCRGYQVFFTKHWRLPPYVLYRRAHLVYQQFSFLHFL